MNAVFPMIFSFAKRRLACSCQVPPGRRDLLLLTLAMVGCGHAEMPLAGGKPVSYWVVCISDADSKLREQAVVKLGNVGNTDAAVFPALTNALDDREPAVRRAAILALMKFGPGAEEAVPRLRELRLKDPDAQVREYAGRAVERLPTKEPRHEVSGLAGGTRSIRLLRARLFSGTLSETPPDRPNLAC